MASFNGTKDVYFVVFFLDYLTGAGALPQALITEVCVCWLSDLISDSLKLVISRSVLVRWFSPWQKSSLLITTCIRRTREVNIFSLSTPVGGGYPHLASWRLTPSSQWGVTPILPDRGCPIFPDGGLSSSGQWGSTLIWSTRGYPHPSRWGEHHLANGAIGVPLSGQLGGYNIRTGWGYSPWDWMGYPLPVRTGWDTPCQETEQQSQWAHSENILKSWVCEPGRIQIWPLPHKCAKINFPSQTWKLHWSNENWFDENDCNKNSVFSWMYMDLAMYLNLNAQKTLDTRNQDLDHIYHTKYWEFQCSDTGYWYCPAQGSLIMDLSAGAMQFLKGESMWFSQKLNIMKLSLFLSSLWNNLF